MSGARLFGDVAQTADISDCGTYRYRLGRRWGPGSSVLWIMLNPSTADADVDDPTIRRCIGFAKRWGHDAIEVVNLYALRATDPQALLRHRDPFGPRNWHTLQGAIGGRHALNVAAWGAKAVRVPASTHVHVPMMAGRVGARVHCLAVTKDGHPRHPLYVEGDADPVLFGGAR